MFTRLLRVSISFQQIMQLKLFAFNWIEYSIVDKNQRKLNVHIKRYNGQLNEMKWSTKQIAYNTKGKIIINYSVEWW